ncbi:SMC-Scp complex subunit ScpB [Facklamia hominis]|uniref:SMC-Scp complex subunit ScpB n=1 Tax=Facklamia hominis TaxID=178214 RepID=UPI0029D41086|nr:SMC-Scp complex subunit ScpB [Facklamia hominis]WPJ89962.1 SMC-Scp complex subunit ScpB [Facklamia hominis]
MIRKIAGLLFVAGEEGISLEALQETLKVPQEELLELLAQLQHHLSEDSMSPIDLVNYGQRYFLMTQSDLDETIRAFAQSPLQQKLSRAAIETLAIVAYRQPVTRVTIDEIRGVSSQAMLQKLLLRDLIAEVGRLDAPGRPLLYGVTPYFYNYFGLTSIDDLPEIKDLVLNTQSTTESLFSFKTWSDYEDDNSSQVALIKEENDGKTTESDGSCGSR